MGVRKVADVVPPKRFRLYDAKRNDRWMAETLPDLLGLVWEDLTPHQRAEFLARAVPPASPTAAFASGAKVADEDAAAVECSGDCGAAAEWQLDVGGEGG